MTIFFSFLLVYISAYLYVFFKLSVFLNFALPGYIILGLFLIFMSLSPALVHMLSMRSSGTQVRVFAYIGFMWMAFLIIFVPVSVLLDIYNLIVLKSRVLFGKDLSRLKLPQAGMLAGSCIVSAVINIYGYFEAKMLRVEKLLVKTSKLSGGAERIKIAQIADLHLGILVGEAALDRVLQKIELEKPDIIVSTGDLFEAAVHHVDHLREKLKNVCSPMGKFAVIGNHELLGGLKHSTGFLEEAGFNVLRGRGVTLNGRINIAGVDYRAEEQKRRRGDAGQEGRMLSNLPSDKFTVLLKHESDVNEASLGLFDLQLSGHTHKGQIFPVNLLTPIVFRYHHGYTQLAKGSALYVSRGAGTAGPPVRFLSPPELTIIEIVSGNSDEGPVTSTREKSFERD